MALDGEGGIMSGPLVLLNAQSAVPPYEQIRVQLRLLIASGQLAARTLLPSVRQLASDLDVAPNTVVRAYRELERDGWVVTSARRGVLVAELPPPMSEQERRQRLEEAVTELLIVTRQLKLSPQEVYAEVERQLGTAGTDDGLQEDQDAFEQPLVLSPDLPAESRRTVKPNS
jgi:GntR family transcriptional regulator